MAVRRQDALGYQFGLLSRLFDRLLENELSEFGVSPGQFPPLVMLYEQDGLTQAELCKRGKPPRLEGPEDLSITHSSNFTLILCKHCQCILYNQSLSKLVRFPNAVAVGEPDYKA